MNHLKMAVDLMAQTTMPRDREAALAHATIAQVEQTQRVADALERIAKRFEQTTGG